MPATSQEVSYLANYKVRADQNAQGEWVQHVIVSEAAAPAAEAAVFISARMEYGSITDDWQDLLDPGGDLKAIHVHNKLSHDVFLELGGTSIDLMTGVSMTLDLGEKNLYTADKVRIKKAAATTLTSGSIVVIGYRGA